MNIEKIKTALQSLLVEFGSVKTIDGTEITYEGEALEVGTSVQAEDGEYELEDGSVLNVKEGVVDSITPKDEETGDGETVDEVTEEVEAEEETTDEIVEEEVTEPEEEKVDYEALIAELTERIAKLEEQVVEILSTPAVQPIEEEFKIITAPKDKKYDHLRNINWKY